MQEDNADLGSIIVGTESVQSCRHSLAPLPLPKPMSPAEYAKHCATHMPHHPGRPFCVMGRRPNSHHRRLPSRNRTVTHVVADYGFLRCRDGDLVTMLVVDVRPWKVYFSTVCSVKGPELSVAHRLAQFVKDCGLRHFTFKSDHNAAVRSLLLEASRLASLKAEEDEPEDADSEDAPDDVQPKLVANDSTLGLANATKDVAPAAVPETSSPGEYQSNGAAERSIQLAEDLSRTLELCLEGKVSAQIPSNHPVLGWLVMYKGTLLTKCRVSGDDQMTGYRRLHGEASRERVPEFGEVVYFFVPSKYRSKWDARLRIGVYLGRSWNSDQNFIGLPSGDVTRARGMFRLVEGKRWSRHRLERITTTPSTERPMALDRIEDGFQPHAAPELRTTKKMTSTHHSTNPLPKESVSHMTIFAGWVHQGWVSQMQPSSPWTT